MAKHNRGEIMTTIYDSGLGELRVITIDGNDPNHPPFKPKRATFSDLPPDIFTDDLVEFTWARTADGLWYATEITVIK